MAMPKPSIRSSFHGFTLIELILVTAILLIVVVTVVPNIGSGISGTQLATASRAVLQGARYARTMALLNQTETELVFISAKNDDDDGKVEVRAAGGASAGGAPPPEVDAPADGEDAEEMAPAEGAPVDAVVEGGSSVAVAAASKDFADEISSTFRCRGVAFSFEGYTDNVDDEGAEAAKPAAEDGAGEDFPPITIRFRSNGSCRPFDVRVLCAGGELSYLVKVGRSGKGKIEGYGEEN